jgi:hypothetical protein
MPVDDFIIYVYCCVDDICRTIFAKATPTIRQIINCEQ